MKKIIICFLLAAMFLSLCACGGGGEAAPEGGDINAAIKAYNSLSDENKLKFFDEISAEQQTLRAAKLEGLKTDLFGQWCLELDMSDESDAYYADELSLSEDMRYVFGRQTGNWHFNEDGEIEFVNDEDGVIYYIFSIIEEDGFVKLLSEGDVCYVRSEDYDAVFESKYVKVKGTKAAEYFGMPKYVGSSAEDMGFGAGAPLYILQSLAYDKGLIYVGTSPEFEMNVKYELKDGDSFESTMFYPFDLQTLPDDIKSIRPVVYKGEVYFVRAEYVDEVVLGEDGCREIRLKTGQIYYDGYTYWDDLMREEPDKFKY